MSRNDSGAGPRYRADAAEITTSTRDQQHGTAPVTAEQFDELLCSLLITWPEGDQPYIGPIDERTEPVAAWLEAVLSANPPLVEYVWRAFGRVSEVAPGVRVLPVASLKGALVLTLQHGAFVGASS